MADRIFWVDNLRPAVVLHLAWARLRDRKIQEIRYLYLGRKGRILARVLRLLGILRVSILPARFSLGDMRSPSGSSLFYQLEEDVLRIATEIMAQIDSYGSLADLLGSALPREKVQLFLEKALVDEIYPAVMLAHVASWHQRNTDEMRDLDHTLLIKDPWLPCLRSHLERDGLRLRGYRTPAQFAPRLYILFRLLWSLTKLFRIFSQLLLQGRRALSDARTTPPVIAVQYADGADLRKRCDYFWYPGSRLDPRQILVYFDRSDTPATEGIVALIEGLGMSWLVLRKRATRINGSETRRGDWGYLRGSLKGLALSLSLTADLLRNMRPERIWQWKQIHNLLVMIPWWESFFRAHNVKIHIHTIDTSPWIVAQALAMERAGGLSAGYHWSHYSMTAAHHCRPQDVYFCWGPHYEPYLRGERSRVDYLVYSGHVSTSARGEGVRAEPMHKTLRVKGAEYLICLFDSSFGDTCHYSQTMAAQLYTAFLQEVLQDHRLGLIVKPKNQDYIERLPEIAGLLEQALNTGRCLVLSHQCSPTEAAHGADMAIGLGLNSAVIEAVLSGTPGVHCDLTHNRDNPFYDWGYERVVFDDLSRLMEALRLHRQDPQSQPLLGDHTPVLSQIDPFQDSKGALRFGLYLRWLMEGFNRGATAEEALQEANTNYGRQFGTKMVVPFDKQENLTVAAGSHA